MKMGRITYLLVANFFLCPYSGKHMNTCDLDNPYWYYEWI